MDKILGRFGIFIIFLLTHMYVQPSAVLRMLDMSNKPAQEIAVGQPAKLAISVPNGSLDRPDLPPVEHMSINGRETRMHIINGQRTTECLFVVSFDKPGEYEIGPLDVYSDGNKLITNKVAFKVVVGKATTSLQGTDVFARLFVEKKTAFVGEKIQCYVEVYCAADDIRLQNIGQPQLPNATVELVKAPYISGTKVLEGTTYTVVQCFWNIYPKKAGMLIVPALPIDYARQRDSGSSMSFFWGPSYVSKRIYSNAASFNVLSLPPHDPPVEAIGSFSSFTATIDPAKASEGEGMVLRLEVSGTGNFNAITMPPLQAIPDEFKWYESKSYETPATSKTAHKKSFEYIVQGIKPGTWTIPAQLFRYFDVDKREYKVVQTKPLQVTITPLKLSTVSKPMDISSQETAVQESPLVTPTELRSIHEQGALQTSAPFIIPWYIFVLLLGVSGIGAIFVGMKKNQATHAAKIDKKQVFKKAYQALQTSIKNNNAEQLYPLFIDLFQKLYSSDKSLTESDIESLLQKSLSAEQLHDWQDFWILVTAALFSDTRMQDYSNHKGLLSRAQKWLSILEEKL